MNTVFVSRQILVELKDCITQLDNSTYAAPLDVFFGSTIGQHTRHIVEFYQCLIEQSLNDQICYDKRRRDLTIETNIETAVQVIDRISEAMESLDREAILDLICDYDVDNQHPFSVKTNVDRELIYNIEHAIHHMALIKIGLFVAAPHVQVSKEFGVAPSTVRHKAHQA